AERRRRADHLRSPGARARILGGRGLARRQRPLAWASVLSSDVDRPSRRLHTQRPPHAPLVTARTTEQPALIPHEVPAGTRRRTAIPARPGMKRPARAGNPRLERKRQDRPVTPAGFDFVTISDHFHPWLFSHHHSPYAWSVLGALAAQ